MLPADVLGFVAHIRSLFNLYINLKWLTKKEVEYRMQRYADFESINRFLAAEACAKYVDFSPERKAKLKEIKKEADKVRRKYKLKKNGNYTHGLGRRFPKLLER